MGIARDPVNSRLPGASLKDYPRSAAMRESMNRCVYDDRYFQVISPKLPLNCREDGGHLILVKKNKVRDRFDLSYQSAIDFMRITMIVGQVMYEVLDIERMNL